MFAWAFKSTARTALTVAVCCYWKRNRWTVLGWGLLSQFSQFRYFPPFFRMIKTLIICMISRSCLTGVAAAELRRHLLNRNVIETYNFDQSKFLVTEKLTNEAVVTPPPPPTGSLTHWGRNNRATIFQKTFWNEFSWMKMCEFRLKFHWSLFLGAPINNIPALVQIMAWRREGDKPLSETMMVSLLTHICYCEFIWSDPQGKFKLLCLYHELDMIIHIRYIHI